MSPLAFATCGVLLAIAVVVAALRGRRGLREGRGPLALARLKSPTPYLFGAYLAVAAFVTPLSEGESTSPLLWLVPVLLSTYVLATLSAIGSARPTLAIRLSLALVHAAAVAAGAALVLAAVSPRFVPAALRPQ